MQELAGVPTFSHKLFMPSVQSEFVKQAIASYWHEKWLQLSAVYRFPSSHGIKSLHCGAAQTLNAVPAF